MNKLPIGRSSLVSLLLVGALLEMPPLSRAADLKTIQQRGQLIVAVKDNLRPLGFRGPDGQLLGFEIEIARRLAQELLNPGNAGADRSIVLKPVLNRDRLTTVLNDEADIAIASVTATAGRARLVTFSLPYYLDGTALVTKTPAIQKLSQLANQPIAVLRNSTTIEVLRYRLPQATLVGVDSYAAAKAAIERGEAIAFAADASVLVGWVQDYPDYRLLSPTLSVEPLCIVIPKGLQYDELRRRINQILTGWDETGWLKERAAYWGLP